MAITFPWAGAAAENATPEEALNRFIQAVEEGDVAAAQEMVDQSSVEGQKATEMVESLVRIAQAFDAFQEAGIEKFGSESWEEQMTGQLQGANLDVTQLSEGITIEEQGGEALVSIEGLPQGQQQPLRLVRTEQGWKIDFASSFTSAATEDLDRVVDMMRGMADSFQGLEDLVAEHDSLEGLKAAFGKEVMGRMLASMSSQGEQGVSEMLGALQGSSPGAVLPNEVQVLNGDIIRGEIIEMNRDGILLRLNAGGYERIHWSTLSQKTLKQLSNHPQAEQFTFPYIQIPPERENPDKDVEVQEVAAAVDRPEFQGGLFSFFATPVGLFLLVVLFIGNIYAGYSIGSYREHPPALAGAISAVVPILGPIIFLSLPNRSFHRTDSEYPMETEMPPPAEGVGEEGGYEAPPEEEPGAAAQKPAGLNISQSQAAAAAAGAQTGKEQTFSRDNHEFDRGFFEQRFPNFFRVVRTGPDKDQVLAIKTPKQEYVGRRISRISASELHLQLQRGSSEVRVPFGEITEVQIRHKDAKK